MKNAPDDPTKRPIWIGRWTMAVAALHTAFAAIVMHDPLLEIARRGLFDAIGRDAEVAAPAWFVLFGFVLFILGLAISALERATPQRRVPVDLGWAMLALCAIGIVLMPVSGFYLALVPAIAILVRGYRGSASTLRATSP